MKNLGMKRFLEYIERKKSILTNEENLEDLFCIKNAPVYMGCTTEDPDEDLFADMDWGICPDTGLIQLKRRIPLETLYLHQHNEGCGSVWLDHYESFSKFIQKYRPQNILEIGGAHGLIAQDYCRAEQGARWSIIEPNPTLASEGNILVIKGWFDEHFSFDQKVDAVVHSHVLEHVYQPAEFISHVGKFLRVGDKHIFTYPNMLEMLGRKYTNCLNFEHTVFLTEYFTDYLLLGNGFKILEKEYFRDHSIFYATEKISEGEAMLPPQNKYTEYKKLFTDFIIYHQELVRDLNDKISKTNHSVYLFGAHIFSQALINFGLKTEDIVSILDNGVAKQGKRLYGSSLNVESTKVLEGKGPVNVILKAGAYNDEIKKDILENINSEVVFW